MDILELKTLLEDRLRIEKAFVTYCEPDSNTLVTWICDSADFKPLLDVSEPGFIFSPFDANLDSVFFSRSTSKMIRTPMESLDWSMSAMGENSYETTLTEADRSDHIDRVNKAVDKIRLGKAEKIVVSRKEEIRDIHLDSVGVFLRLVSLYPLAYSYIWFHPDVGLWAGSTPEILVEVEEKRFVTMSLAGTQRHVENKEVKWGEKERDEQQMVTDLIQKELGSMVDYTGEPHTQRAGHLLHLRTDISGTLQDDKRISDLIKRLHPTAAICGLPRKQALEFIHLNEGYSREYYTGFLGEIHHPDSGSAHLVVNLRCMQLFPHEKKAWIYIGGGITSSSNPEEEWEETRAKSETMKRVFS